MMHAKFFTLALTLSSLFGVPGFGMASASAAETANAGCPAPWKCEIKPFNVPYKEVSVSRVAHVKLRTGYRPEQGAFKGNVLYFEGLADSLLNHEPLFKKLNAAGYRVIAFDYMGQGGSNGKMDHTRLPRIGELGNLVWDKYARLPDPSGQKTIIGWSTGGLAAYLMALKNEADRVVLIAPGIAPNLIVGAGLLNWPPDEITLRSLTTATYDRGESNPHHDGIQPSSPAVVPNFAINLIRMGAYSRTQTVPSNVKGLVLLSGPNDTYVDANLTRKTLKGSNGRAGKAEHFEIITYPRALHEIDNESDLARTDAQLEGYLSRTLQELDARDAIVDFLKRTQN